MIRVRDAREELEQAVVVLVYVRRRPHCLSLEGRSTQIPTTRLVSFVIREKDISLLEIQGDAKIRPVETVSHMRYCGPRGETPWTMAVKFS